MFLAHEARLNAPVDGGGTVRSHLEQAAKGRNAPSRARALAQLETPDYPQEVHYLRTWVNELHGRSGVTDRGVVPLKHSEIAAWARLTGRRPAPHEVQALLRLDAVLCHPSTETEQ